MVADILQGIADLLRSGDTLISTAAIFLVGLIAGFFLAKTIKILVVTSIVIIVSSYFGVVSINREALDSLVQKYGPLVGQFSAFALSSSAFIVGALIGFVAGLLR